MKDSILGSLITKHWKLQVLPGVKTNIGHSFFFGMLKAYVLHRMFGWGRVSKPWNACYSRI